MTMVRIRNVRMVVLDRVVSVRMGVGLDYGAVVVVPVMFVVNVQMVVNDLLVNATMGVPRPQ